MFNLCICWDNSLLNNPGLFLKDAGHSIFLIYIYIYMINMAGLWYLRGPQTTYSPPLTYRHTHLHLGRCTRSHQTSWSVSPWLLYIVWHTQHWYSSIGYHGTHCREKQPQYKCSFLNSSLPGRNGRHFADDIFRCIFVNEQLYILIKISLKFVPKGPLDNNPALV